MSFGMLVLASIVFIESFLFLDLGRKAGNIARTAQGAMHGLRDRGLDDDEKEAIARAAARRIFAATAVFLLQFGLVAGIIGAGVLGLAALSPAVGRELLAELSSPLALTALTAIAVGYGCMRGWILR
jgi:hypothetical protein